MATRSALTLGTLAGVLAALVAGCDYGAVIGKNSNHVDVGDGGTVECNGAPCAAGTYCVTTDGRARCEPYATCATAGVCANGAQCEDRPIQCVTAPCPPTAPTCVDPSSTQDGGATGPACGSTRCATGTYCVESDGGAQCRSYPTCATAGVCATGTHCEDRPIQCVTAPCPPTAPSCVANTSTGSCATARCASGTYCDDSSGAVQCVHYATCATAGACPSGQRCYDDPIQCFRAPCPPTAVVCR